MSDEKPVESAEQPDQNTTSDKVPATVPEEVTLAESPAQPVSASEANPDPVETPEITKQSEKKPRPDPVEESVRQELIKVLQANLEFFKSLGDQLTNENIQRLLELGSSLPELILQISKSKTIGLDDDSLANARLLKAVMLAEKQNQQMTELISDAAGLTARKTGELARVRKLLRQFKSEIGWPQEAPKSAIYDKLLATELQLDELAEKNQQFQEQLLSATNELVESLGKALEQGNSSEASALWDKIQNNINNLSGRAQHDFKLQTTEFRNQVNELRGWKKFAATEKKKELIEQMKQLAGSDTKASDRAREINKLHEEWKHLGYSNQNETLWREFKSQSDEAYAPCKEYFKQQKTRMVENFNQRSEICRQLETFLENLNHETVKIIELKKFEEKAQEDWKKYAPVEQSKVKKLQKRFYDSLNKIRDIRRTAAKKNGELKKSLVDQARKLLDLEDRREAMNMARNLQAEWKTIGPSIFKEDKKLWEDFRAACDTLFKERDEARKALKSDIENALKASNDILKKLEQFVDMDEDALRQSRKLFSSLQHDFNQVLSSKIRKERQQILNQFNTLSRKIEARFKKLPDKKQIQALNSLQAKATLCCELEQQLLECKDDESLKKILSETHQEKWQALDKSGMPDLDKLIEARWNGLMASKSVNHLKKQVVETNQQARKQVVEAEIRANVDSPDQDKSLRMELQLNQLTTNFGKASAPDNNSRERDARQFQLHFLCIGPLSPSVRTELEKRVAAITQKVL